MVQSCSLLAFVSCQTIALLYILSVYLWFASLLDLNDSEERKQNRRHSKCSSYKNTENHKFSDGERNRGISSRFTFMVNLQESTHDMVWRYGYEGMNFLELVILLYLFVYLFVYLPKFIAHLRNLNFYASFLVYLCLSSQVALLLKTFSQVTFTVMHISFVNIKGYFDWQKP